MSEVRLGFIGVGGMGQCAHLRNYVTVPNCRVVAIAEVRDELGKKVAERYGIPKVYHGHKDLLANEEIDGLVAIQNFAMHASLVPELLEKRVPIITEKPLSESVANGEKILAAVQKTGTPLYLAYHKRSDPASVYALRQAQAWKQSGEVGKFRYLRVAMPPGKWDAEGFAHLISTKEGYSVPPVSYSDPYIGFVNYYIHQVNLIRFFLEEDYHVSYADPSGIILVGHGDSGTACTLEMATHHTSIDWQEEVFLAFDHGWIKVELPAPLALDRPGKVTVFRDPGKGEIPTTTTPVLPWYHAMRQQAIHFVNAVRGEKTVLSQAADGLKDLQVAAEYVKMVADAKAKKQ